ncbi:discoidin domain-containing protein [Paenibacillus polysaccharolyticus]|uniref:discoidin domain-containing protein n=1 Tax=Paenibacillus polysaccharolyticus TaxID=582692 RepID=UPI003008CAB0
MAIYYVDGVNGNDSFSGSVSTPFLTIDKALTVIATSSDVIILTAQKGMVYRVTSITPFQTKSFTLKSDKSTYAVVDFNGLACNVATFGKRFEYIYVKNMGTWNSNTGNVSLVYENCVFEGVGNNASFWTNSSSVTMSSVLIRKFNLKSSEGYSVNLIRGVNSSSFTNVVILDCAGATAYTGSVSLSKSIIGSTVALSLVAGDYVNTTTNEESRIVNSVKYGLLVSTASALAVSKILLSSGDKYYSLLNDGIQETTSIPKMTSNTTPEGEVFVSNTPNGNATFGWEAFDGAINTSWGGNTLPTTMPKWIGYKFSEPKVIVKYRLRFTNTTYYPRNYEFQGSTDGIVYDTLHSIVEGSSGVLDYVIPNRRSYTHYRLYITVLSSGNQLPSVYEFEMFEVKPSYLVEMRNASESDFLNQGVVELNNFSQILNIKKEMTRTDEMLGSGKTFEHTVDMSKRRIDKIILR